MDPLCLPGSAGEEKRGAGSPQGAYLPSSSCTQLFALPPPLPASLNVNHACIAVARTWNTYVSTGKSTKTRLSPDADLSKVHKSLSLLPGVAIYRYAEYPRPSNAASTAPFSLQTEPIGCIWIPSDTLRCDDPSEWKCCPWWLHKPEYNPHDRSGRTTSRHDTSVSRPQLK